jgi:hypothetical protein
MMNKLETGHKEHYPGRVFGDNGGMLRLDRVMISAYGFSIWL